MKRKIFLVLLFVSTSQLFAQQKMRLTNNWEFLKQDLGSVWETVRPVKQGNPESLPLWDSVTLPHCVNGVQTNSGKSIVSAKVNGVNTVFLNL